DRDLDRTAERLALEVREGRRELPSGETVRWRSAGLDAAERGDSLPFFIRWDVPARLHPSRMRDVEPGWAIDRVRIGDAPDVLERWVDDARLPIEADGDGGAVRSVTLRSPLGPIEIA